MTTTETIHDRYPHLATTEGWLYDETAQLTEDLLRDQTDAGISGDILEIGVYLGRYFILLGRNLAPDEHLIGVDIFESQTPRIPHSANATRAELTRNVRHYLNDLWMESRVHLIEADSQEWARSLAATSMGGTCRFISIDGSHDTETVASDLRLAERLLVPSGLAALDDVNDDVPQQWPGVLEAWHAYQEDDQGKLIEVARVPNKLLLTNDSSAANAYREVLNAHKIGAPS